MGNQPQAGKAAAQATTGSVQPVTVNIVQPDKAAEAAANITAGYELNQHETIAGGRYMVRGQLVNADGEPIKDDDKKAADDKDDDKS